MAKKKTYAPDTNFEADMAREAVAGPRDVTDSSINQVCENCSRIEKDAIVGLPLQSKSLRLDQKLLNKQRRDLMAAIALNQAKTIRINKTLQKLAFQYEGEMIIARANDTLEMEE